MKDKQKNKKAKKQEQDFEMLYKRAIADYQNLTKQTAKEKEEFARYVKSNMIMEFIPIYENLKLAVDHTEAKKENGEGLPKETEEVALGVKVILSQFEKILQENGVDIIDEIDVEFDPEKHEAVTQITTDKKEKVDKIAMIVKSGYKLGDKVIQVAKVAVYSCK